MVQGRDREVRYNTALSKMQTMRVRDGGPSAVLSTVSSSTTSSFTGDDDDDDDELNEEFHRPITPP